MKGFFFKKSLGSYIYSRGIAIFYIGIIKEPQLLVL